MDALTSPTIPATERARALARRLIGVKLSPTGFEYLTILARESRAYFYGDPYPWCHFREWKTEERGPYPRCMPLVRTAIKRGARWLFGKPVQVKVPANTTLETYLATAWQANRMPTRMVAAAERGAVEGGTALKWSYDKDCDPPLQFQTLSIVDQVRFYWDPHDRDRLLMARIQYPYQDPIDGTWWFYREEWTDELLVHYRPVRAQWNTPMNRGITFPPLAVTTDGQKSPDEYEKWEEERREPNLFRVIPVVPIKNIDAEEAFGIGDLWGLFRVVDRINLAYHLMDRSNQTDVDPTIILLDVDGDRADIDRPLQPGQMVSLKSDEAKPGEVGKGSIEMLEARGHLRPAMMEYAKDLTKQVHMACGSVLIDQAEISNKGNLTTAVLTQIYAPLIEMTEEKRKTYGEDGIAKFLERCSVGLSNAGLQIPEVSGVDATDHDSFDVQLGWPSYFTLTEEEKTAIVTRVTGEIPAGLMTHERALELVAHAEGILDVQVFKDELAHVSAIVPDAQAQAAGPQDQLNEHDVADRTSQRAIGEFQGGVATRDEARKSVGKPPVSKRGRG